MHEENGNGPEKSDLNNGSKLGSQPQDSALDGLAPGHNSDISTPEKRVQQSSPQTNGSKSAEKIQSDVKEGSKGLFCSEVKFFSFLATVLL